MVLFRKCMTAARLLSQYGPDVVWGMVRDNFREMGRSFRWACRRFERLPSAPQGQKTLHILYVAITHEARDGQTSRYRIYNFMEALKGRAETRLATLEGGIPAPVLRWADLAVLMRAPRTEDADRFFNDARRAGLPVVFDIDDLIFLPSFFPSFCKTLPGMSEKDKAYERNNFDGFYENFRRSAGATASTPFIAEQMRKEGREAFVIHNGLNCRQIRIAARAVRRKTDRRPEKERTILYLSGSKTHERDFAQALPALTRIMKEYPDVRLCVVGYLDVSALPPAVAARTKTVPFMEWGRMLAFTASCTINIAPLDTANPFCHAKSELKYFEAGLVGVPTVASPTDSFRLAIRSGENGLLAETEDDWYQALSSLLSDKALYRRIAEAARADALARYSPEKTAEEALGAYRAILETESRKAGPAE